MRRLPLPQALVDRAHAYASGAATPVAPRDAATVVLLRPSDAGPEVYLLRRQSSMAFAAGMYVFPGGGVDPRDFDAADEHWVGPSPTDWAARLGCADDLARALVCAAVRETFEESGVLLAGPSADTVVAATGEDWERDRAALESREVAFSDLLADRGLVLRTDLLGAWAGWLTPVFEPRRYRTWFFVAVLPTGQVARDASTESASVTWLPARSAIDAAESGEVAMMPPTYLTCLDVAKYADPAAVLAEAASRRVEMFTPEVVADADEFILSTPPQYADLLDARPPR